MTAALDQIWFGEDWRHKSSATPAFNNYAVDASNDGLAFLFQAAEAATINRLGVRLGVNTGTSPTYRLSLQGANVSGTSAVPDGAIKGATNNALKTFSPSGLGWAAGSWNWLTLDETYAVSRGELLTIVVDYSSGTVDGSNNSSFTYNLGAVTNTGLPRAMTNAAGAYSAQTSGLPIYGYGSSGTAYGRPIQALSSVSLTSASSPREAGLRWTAPAGWGATYQLGGCDIYMTPASSATALTLQLYSGGGASDLTVLQDVALSQGAVSSAGGQRSSQLLFNEATLSDLNHGDTYRVVLSTAAATLVVRSVEVANAADWDAFPGGQNSCWTSRDSGGNWTDVTTRRPFDWGLLIKDLVKPSGGGLVVSRRQLSQVLAPY